MVRKSAKYPININLPKANTTYSIWLWPFTVHRLRFSISIERSVNGNRLIGTPRRVLLLQQTQMRFKGSDIFMKIRRKKTFTSSSNLFSYSVLTVGLYARLQSRTCNVIFFLSTNANRRHYHSFLWNSFCPFHFPLSLNKSVDALLQQVNNSFVRNIRLNKQQFTCHFRFYLYLNAYSIFFRYS